MWWVLEAMKGAQHIRTSVWKKYFMISCITSGYPDSCNTTCGCSFFLVGVVEWLFWQTSLQGLVWRHFKKHFSPKKDVAGIYWSHLPIPDRSGVVCSNLKGLFDPSCCIYQASSCKALLFEGSRGRIFGRLSMIDLPKLRMPVVLFTSHIYIYIAYRHAVHNHAESSWKKATCAASLRNLEFNELEDLPESLWKKSEKKQRTGLIAHVCSSVKVRGFGYEQQQPVVPGKHQNNVHIGMDWNNQWRKWVALKKIRILIQELWLWLPQTDFPGIPGIIRKQGATVRALHPCTTTQNSTPQEDLFQGLGKLKVLWLTGNHYQPGEKGYKKMKARLMF